jgi:hypothetical protein
MDGLLVRRKTKHILVQNKLQMLQHQVFAFKVKTLKHYVFED